ncbi:MAG: NUDIX domain-containing protein [Chloroflexota bacterium]
MSDQHSSGPIDGSAVSTLVDDGPSVAQLATSEKPPKVKKDKKKKPKKTLEERKVYEAGAVIVCDGKVVLRLTDKQRWIFPKGKLKKHEAPEDAALREATEETGLRVEIVDQLADFLMHHEGKKRRFQFFLMRATAKTWDWPHHEGRDTFLISPERVGPLVRQEGYADVWAAGEDRVRAMCDEPTPFVTHGE